MIAKLSGKIAALEGNEWVIDVNGVGYQVTVGKNLALKKNYQAGDDVEIVVYTVVRADEIRLFGFEDFFSRKVFALLLGVSGVGPKIAQNLIDQIGPSPIIRAIYQGDLNPLIKVPGVGQKTAQRIELDLKAKIKGLEEWWRTLPAGEMPRAEDSEKTIDEVIKDARSALLNLGFSEREIETTLKKHAETKRPLDEVIRKCLADLRKII